MEIPERFKLKLLKKKLVRYNNKWMTIAVTDEVQLVEIGTNGNINNFIKMNINDNVDDIQFSVVNTSHGYLLCVVRVADNLVVYKRFDDCFKLTFKEKKVEEFRIRSNKNVNNSSDDRWILFYKTTSGEGMKTNFCELCKIPADGFRNPDIEKYLHKERQRLRCSLDKAIAENRSRLASLLQRQKFISKLSRFCDDIDEVSPLVRFGSIFKRVCNQKLIVGLPLLNISKK